MFVSRNRSQNSCIFYYYFHLFTRGRSTTFQRTSSESVSASEHNAIRYLETHFRSVHWIMKLKGIAVNVLQTVFTFSIFSLIS
jgi:hypothetical protein